MCTPEEIQLYIEQKGTPTLLSILLMSRLAYRVTFVSSSDNVLILFAN